MVKTKKRKFDPVVSEGFKSFWDGTLSNPYKVNTEKNRRWELGFNKAYFINLDKVKKREERYAKKANTSR